MGKKPKIRGYKWNEYLADAIRASSAAVGYLGQYLDHPNGALGGSYLTHLSRSMADTLAALHKLRSIGEANERSCE